MPAHRHVLPAVVLLALFIPISPCAQEAEPDLSRWSCRLCEFETGFDGDLGLSAGLVFDDAYRFGYGTGLEDAGAFLDGDVSLTWWGEGARFFAVDGSKLGTRARDIYFSGGDQGRYEFSFGYDEIPTRLNNSGSSPFTNIGSSALALPSGWLTAGNAQLMPGLASALTPVGIGQNRKAFDFGLRFFAGSRWSQEISWRHEARDGLQPFSGSFLTLSTVLPAPIDYETDILEATVAYTASRWQANLGYYGSFFSNNAPILSWQNPFSPIVPGADFGSAARPPDNDFHQLTLSGNYRWQGNTRLVGHLALGKASQNDAFAPYTVNSLLASNPLPALSADARVDSTLINGGARLSGKLFNGLNFKAFYRKHERDNQTPIYAMQTVTTDVYQDVVRRNSPFSFDKSQFGLDLGYRLPGQVRASAGFEREEYDRDYQEVRKTSENSLWFQIFSPAGEVASANLRAKHQDRNGSGYRPVDALAPPENPLLRKFNLADRERDQIAAEINVSPFATTDISFSMAYSADEYPDSLIGLISSEDRSYTLDAGYNPIPRLSLHGFITRQAIEYTQAGSEVGNATVIWSVQGEDRFVTGGASVNLRSTDGKQKLSVEYARSNSKGTNFIQPGSGNFAFPELSTNLETLALDLNVRFKERLSARFRYQYERYHSRDWTIEGVTPTTIGSILTFGENLPNYSQQVLWLGLVRSF